MSGTKLDTPHRKSLLASVLNGFGVTSERDQLIVRATKENFPLKKHSLIQVILAVNDMFILSAPVTKNIFFDDVKDWLDSSDVRYIPNMTIHGVSGFSHVFDFAIPKSRSAPERLLKAISNPSRDKVQNLAFAWYDTRDLRPETGKAYAILNDNERLVSGAIADALRTYDIIPVQWSQRQKVFQQLVA